MNEVDAYIAGFAPDVRERLEALRAIVREEAPEVMPTERICMRMPTYDLGGKWFVHFAAYPKHIGFYPQPESIVDFAQELAAYKTSKGGVQFPLNKPMPYDLIRAMIRHKVAVYRTANEQTPFEALLKRLSKPARQAIEAQGIDSLAGLAAYSDREMLAWHGLGKASLPHIHAALDALRKDGAE